MSNSNENRRDESSKQVKDKSVTVSFSTEERTMSKPEALKSRMNLQRILGFLIMHAIVNFE